MSALIIMTLCAVPLFILGMFMKKGKGLMLLAGYNTMPDEERDKIDKHALGKSVGNLLIRMAAELTALGVAIYSGISWAAMACIFVVIIDLCVSTIVINRRVAGAAASSKASKVTMILVSIFIAAVLIAVGLLYYYGEKEPAVLILDNHLRIEGMYGLIVPFSDIAGISLIDKSMLDIGIGHRYDGHGGFGDTLKGHFSSENLGKYLLFVDASASPTIWIEREGKEDIYISFRYGAATVSLYQKLQDSF